MKKLLNQTLSFLIIAAVLGTALSQDVQAYNQAVRNDTPFPIKRVDATFASCPLKPAPSPTRPGDNPRVDTKNFLGIECLLQRIGVTQIQTTNVQPAWTPPNVRWTDPNPRTIELDAPRWVFSGTGAGAQSGQWVVRGPYVTGRDGKEVLLYHADKRDANNPIKGWDLTAIAAEAGTDQPTGVPYIYKAGTGSFKITRD